MARRYLWLGVALASVLALPACYDVPQPNCGFRCGPGGACPERYVCSNADGICHLDTAPATLRCGTIDASVPDAPFDGAPPDAP
jgi:hypothetical protein